MHSGPEKKNVNALADGFKKNELNNADKMRMSDARQYGDDGLGKYMELGEFQNYRARVGALLGNQYLNQALDASPEDLALIQALEANQEGYVPQFQAVAQGNFLEEAPDVDLETLALIEAAYGENGNGNHENNNDFLSNAPDADAADLEAIKKAFGGFYY